MSSGNIPAALPRIYLSKPDWLPLPDCWIDVSNKIPMPKNTERIIPIDASVLIFVVSEIYWIVCNAIQPEIDAAINSKRPSFSPVSKKAIQIPGNTACATASPASDCLLRTVKQPIAADWIL